MIAALNGFKHMLSTEQATKLAAFSSSAPTPEDVLRLTTEITTANRDRKSRIYASRIQGILSSVQQYSSVIDVCTGPNQIAALVWGSVKLVILVSVSTRVRIWEILINNY